MTCAELKAADSCTMREFKLWVYTNSRKKILQFFEKCQVYVLTLRFPWTPGQNPQRHPENLPLPERKDRTSLMEQKPEEKQQLKG